MEELPINNIVQTIVVKVCQTLSAVLLRVGISCYILMWTVRSFDKNVELLMLNTISLSLLWLWIEDKREQIYRTDDIYSKTSRKQI